MNIVSKIYFYSMWYVGTPVMVVFIIIYAFIGYAPMSVWYGDADIYPVWTDVIGMKSFHLKTWSKLEIPSLKKSES